MTQPTPRELADARALLHAVIHKERHLASLTARRDALRAVIASDNSRRNERVDFQRYPERLAGAAEHFHRTDPNTAQNIELRYRWMLEAMHDGTLALESMARLQPMKVDFMALPLAARPYLIAPFIKYAVGGVYPRLDLAQSYPARGHLVLVATHGPLDVAVIRKALPAISEWLTGPNASDSFEVTAHAVNAVTLTRRAALPDNIPFTRAQLRAGHLYVGINTVTHHPHHVVLADMPHLLIAGTTGMGKSNGLHVLLRSLLANIAAFEAVHLVSGSGGVAFNRYHGLHPKVRTYSTPEEVADLTTRLVATMRARESILAARHADKVTTGFIALVIDEYARFNTPDDPDKKSDAHKATTIFLANMLRLGKLGRKTGIRLILSVQNPIEPDVPAHMRAVLPNLMSYRLPLIAHVNALWGSTEGLPVDVRTLQRGRALFRDGLTGELVCVQMPVMSQPAKGAKP